ncbi:MAG: hypothetical protein AAF604_14065 [Acidobacteriota bacterium]
MVLRGLLVLGAISLPLVAQGYAEVGDREAVTRSDELLLVDEPMVQIPVRVTYPSKAATGKLPVILFSHGAGGSKENEKPIVTAWAAAGYVVIEPDHDDRDQLRRAALEGSPGAEGATEPGPRRRGGRGGAVASPRAGSRSGALGAGQSRPRSRRGGSRGGELRQRMRQMLQDPETWRRRVADLQDILDHLDRVEAQIPALAGRLDRERIGVGGHSFGAFTSQLMAGARSFALDGSVADPRPRAFVLLSPQGRGQQGLADSSWDDCRRPMLAVSGSEDGGFTGQSGEDKLDPYRFGPPEDKLGLMIDGAAHASFTGRLTQDSAAQRRQRDVDDERRLFEWIVSATVAFWDAYLKEEPKAQRYLASDALAEASGGRADLRRREVENSTAGAAYPSP